MTLLDWAIVVGINFTVFGYGLFRSSQTRTPVDWFLGGRSLPFWIVAVSMFATSVDAGDIVALSGLSYTDGISILSVWWMGVVIGYIVTAFFVLPPMYRGAMFTNAEYLEVRFGPAARVISVLVQVQYRTNILAGIAISLQLILTRVMGVEGIWAWAVVVAFAGMATFYSARGGLKTIAWADAFLTVSMILGTLVLWLVVWQAVGGWEGATAALASRGGAELPAYLLHIGTSRPGQPDALIVVAAWVIIGAAYPIVNHSEAMKLFGARSLWDVKMSVLLAAAVTMVMMYFNGTLGILGRALWPETLQRPDEIYPLLVDRFLSSGLKGIVVAGVVSAAMTTYEGIGSALSALCTRDIYARLITRDREDAHYLKVSRMVTPVVIGLSFLYIPFILNHENIASFFVRVTSVFVIPLMTVYLMGVFTRVHRRSGLVGLIAGSSYGILAVIGSSLGMLPVWLTDRFVAYLWSIAITSGAMILSSLVLSKAVEKDALGTDESGWLRRSQADVPEIQESPFPGGVPFWWLQPHLWAGIVLATSFVLVFYIFW